MLISQWVIFFVFSVLGKHFYFPPYTLITLKCWLVQKKKRFAKLLNRLLTEVTKQVDQLQEMDPLCEALISQSKISPSDLQRLTSDCNMEGYLDCKILDENSKVSFII